MVQTNIKAIQLYKRYGFIEEGLLINDRIHKDGNYYNTVIMGRLLDKQSSLFQRGVFTPTEA